MIFQTRCLSSLSKVFSDRELADREYNHGSALRGEVYSFQVAFYSSVYLKDIEVKLESELSLFSQIRHVVSLPGNFLAEEFDDHVIQQKSGLFPELLSEFELLNIPPGQWHSVWITVRLPREVQPGTYRFKITFTTEFRHKIAHQTHFDLDVCCGILPKSRLLLANWMHPDCIMTYYNVEAWSGKHWQLLEKYMANSAAHGTNMILTPLFTLPLDTEVGGERPTTQLVRIFLNDGKYDFDFSLLERWIDMALAAGFEYLEMSHLFTQWGAEKTPKIYASVDGENKRIFGWDVSADCKKYRDFIKAFLPALTSFLKERNLQDKTFFHVSDEPEKRHLESYRTAVSIVRPFLKNFTIIDALSDIDYYRNGIVENPIPILDKLDDFIKEEVKPLWCYYCGGPQKLYSNRLFHFPSVRNRILGIQLFQHDIDGFLHWGYNFWYSQFSKRKLDPFRETDAGCAFPSGDACVVYPGPAGPMDSLRWEVFREGIQDLCACRLLESKIGRKNARDVIQSDFGAITMTHYPRSVEWLLSKRKQINNLVSMCVDDEVDRVSLPNEFLACH